MNVRIYAAIFGLLFLALGIIGFFPEFSPNGRLLYLFTVIPMHNVFHIITGLIGIFVSLVSPHASRVFFKIFAAIYLFVAVLAFMIGGDLVFMRLSTADNLFHLIIGGIFAYLGFGKPRERVVTKQYEKDLPSDQEPKKNPETKDQIVHVDLSDKK